MSFSTTLPSPTAIGNAPLSGVQNGSPPANAAQLHASLGYVPLDRILVQPPIGTATEEDVIKFVDGEPKRLVELVNGVLVEKPMGLDESTLNAWMMRWLAPFVHEHRLGVLSTADGTIRMRAGNIRIPDISFFSPARWRTKEPGKKIPPIAPELAVEILSASNTVEEMAAKRKEYFDSGCVVVWEIDPATNRVAVYREPLNPERTLVMGDRLEAPDILPGFSLALSVLFEDPEQRI
jgi:Uma2 family endonuclease